MGGHGKLTIEAGNAHLDDAYVQRQPDLTPGQYVMLAVTDTGCGIAAELLERVFEPFFTTKPEGQGTGLGLSMVYGFVKQSGGHINIYSEPGHGTTVRLYLPRARAQEDLETNVEAGPAAGGTETVLVVEDDEDVRATVVALLMELGYRILQARDAQSALAIVESGIAIDLIFTDVVMPGTLRSPELARKARERLPNVAVLFTSGYTDNAIVHGGRLDDGIDLLSKPYTRDALARKIRQVLHNQQQKNIARTGARNAPAAVPLMAPATVLRILLVEDDADIRSSTRYLLEALGHTVEEAAHGAAALELLRLHPFDTLMTDLSLPGMPGSEVVTHAVAIQPALRLVVASGYSAPAHGSEHALAKAVFLRKPYDVDALEAALKSAGPGR
jgi:CheY-like chemotaxis protein